MKIGRMCLNWKALVGLGLVGVGVWTLAPNLFLAALPLLVLAVCPLSMLAMMWGMKHVMQTGGHGSSPTPAGLAPGQKERLVDLKAQQAAINQEIGELEQGGHGKVPYRPSNNAGEARY